MSSLFDIKGYLAIKRAQVDEALNRYMLQSEGELAGHIEAMRYSLFAGGKRVRPILCVAAAESVRHDKTVAGDSLLAAACALECIHTYSLIHDDLPAMDNDDLRRGRPTNHRMYGEAGAILAGDGLLTFAFDLLSRADYADSKPDLQLKVIEIISRAAGPLGMVGGQAMDLDSEGKEIPFSVLRSIHSRKTGALITASVQSGAVLGGATAEQLDSLTVYGEQIGLAFQIVDDLLNVQGTTEELGKAAGSDALRKKATYPAFFGVDRTKKMAAESVEHALAALTSFDHRADPLRELAGYIIHRRR